jgi:hypothetical protein
MLVSDADTPFAAVRKPLSHGKRYLIVYVENAGEALNDLHGWKGSLLAAKRSFRPRDCQRQAYAHDHGGLGGVRVGSDPGTRQDWARGSQG